MENRIERLDFVKMQSCGNDFVVAEWPAPEALPTPEDVRRLCERHYGVGCDQLLAVVPTRREDADFEVAIFNADGSRAGQCGNGMRCVARYVFDRLRPQAQSLRLALTDRIVEAWRRSEGLICVNMRSPSLAPESVPVLAAAGEKAVEIEREGVRAIALGMGNPHAVVFVERLPEGELASWGEPWQRDERFLESANVEFVTVVDPHTLSMRVFERGAGETLACGSGACAAAVAALIDGRAASPVEVRMPGGVVTVAWEGPGTDVYLTGSAETVFEGRWLQAGRSR